MTEEKNIPENGHIEENGQNKCPKCGSTEISNIPFTSIKLTKRDGVGIKKSLTSSWFYDII